MRRGFRTSTLSYRHSMWYIRTQSPTKRAASSPPVPARSSMMILRLSRGSGGTRRVSICLLDSSASFDFKAGDLLLEQRRPSRDLAPSEKSARFSSSCFSADRSASRHLSIQKFESVLASADDTLLIERVSGWPSSSSTSESRASSR